MIVLMTAVSTVSLPRRPEVFHMEMKGRCTTRRVSSRTIADTRERLSRGPRRTREYGCAWRIQNAVEIRGHAQHVMANRPSLKSVCAGISVRPGGGRTHPRRRSVNGRNQHSVDIRNRRFDLTIDDRAQRPPLSDRVACWTTRMSPIVAPGSLILAESASTVLG